MLVPNRHASSTAYRYGFNGMEKDDELKGEGNSYTTEFRQYDSRIGRWLSLDPEFKAFTWQSPYVAFDNNPISKIDPRGDSAGDPEKITKAAANAVATVKASDNGSKPAKCNIGVNSAFTEITGSNELSGLNANAMKNKMSNSNNFTPIDVSEAQEAANKGEVVIAAWKNPDGGHGHVALVVPGTASMQGTWESQPAKSIGGIPKLMDTGYNMRTEEQAANYSFGKGKQADVVFYKYTPTLSNTNSNEVQASTTKAASTTNSSNITPKYKGYDKQHAVFLQAPEPKFSDYLKESKAPIVRDIGGIISKFGF